MNPADFALPGGFPTTDIDDEDDMGSEVEDGSETGFTAYQTCVNLRVTSAARESVRALIESKGLGWHDAMDELAQQVVDLQVSTFNEHAAAIAAQQADSKLEAARQSLFESTALKIAESIGDDVERDVEALKAIPSSVSKRALWRWDRIPYAAFCALGVKLPDENGEEEGRNRKRQRVEPSESLADVDDWILRNERWLRDDKALAWTKGLVQLSAHSQLVFPEAAVSATSRNITRPTLPGYTFLNQKITPTVEIQPSVQTFGAAFSKLSDELLEGLNWDNVCVAGGIVLASLLCVESPTAAHKADDYISSDIDLYIYGLSPLEANRKIAHIFETYKKNLPPQTPTLVVRNSKTINFISCFPVKRVQIVLKLVKSPKEVLLNFDLDICAMGWDGKEMYMLPRAARALETGYSVFTMSLIEGHYLGDRRASQEQRVFKYADRGYGIRMLPSYIESINHSTSAEETPDINAISTTSREYTDALIKKYLSFGHTTALSYHDLYANGHEPNPKWIATTPAPTFSHMLLETRAQITWEPGKRDCLTGFALLMRHVRLWEMGVKGDVTVNSDVWSSTTYDEFYSTVSYDDSPQYKWDKSFEIATFVSEIDKVNERERTAVNDIDSSKIQRITHSSSVEDILDRRQDIVIPVWLPRGFAEHANTLLRLALSDAGSSAATTLVPHRAEEAKKATPHEFVLYFWRIDNVTMWQQLDRRIDEIFELLWAFHRSVGTFDKDLPLKARAAIIISEIARHTIRKTSKDEFEAFRAWVAREPADNTNCYGGPDQGFWQSDEEDEEE